MRHVLGIAAEVGAPVYFVHQSTAAANELTRAARSSGHPAYSEVCPHYITLDESCYDHQHGEYFTCCPPLRSRATVEALLAAVLAGHADTLASDHCAYGTAVKQRRRGDLAHMPFGMPGVQTRMAVLLSELVVRRGAPISRVVAALSANPARLSGLYPRKGAIRTGADADLVVWNPAAHSTVRADDLVQDSDYTPFEGMAVHGGLELVIRGGAVVCEGGRLLDRSPGQLLASGPITHGGAAVRAA